MFPACDDAVQDCFEGVLGADLMGEYAKPDAAAFQKVFLAYNHIQTLFGVCPNGLKVGIRGGPRETQQTVVHKDLSALHLFSSCVKTLFKRSYLILCNVFSIFQSFCVLSLPMHACKVALNRRGHATLEPSRNPEQTAAKIFM